MQHHLKDLEARKAASIWRVRGALALVLGLFAGTAAVTFLPTIPPKPSTPPPGPRFPHTTPRPAAAEPILNGNQIVALFGMSVAGLLVYGAFSYGRVVTITFEISNTKKLLRINVGKSIGPVLKPRNACLILLGLLAVTPRAGLRTSTDYSIPTDIADGGGAAASSANYSANGSAGTVAGISSVASPVEVAKAGSLVQLYDLTTALVLGAAQTTVNEGGTVPLGLFQLADDASYLLLSRSSVAWSVAGGPLTGIDSSGLATAGLVYQDTAATARAQYLGQTLTLGLTVLDTIPDNFGSYAGDGLPDSWQVQYFGQPPNANAGPNVDFDHTGQANLFKYIAGLNPLDSNSRFTLNIAAVPGQPSQKNLTFSPVVAGRTYPVKSKADLFATPRNPVATAGQTDNGPQRTVTDPAVTGAKKFYHIEITKP